MISINSDFVAPSDKYTLALSGREESYRGRGGRNFCGGCDTFYARYRGCGIFKKCTHCGLTNHTFDNYCDHHGKPSWANQTSIHEEKASHNVVAEFPNEEIFALIKEDYAKSQAPLKGKSPAKSSTVLAHSRKMCILSKQSLSSSIINFGASYHMIIDSRVFSLLNTSCFNSFINLADGSSFRIVGIGIVNPS